jgi:predicted protein tyrosine phosphatase
LVTKSGITKEQGVMQCLEILQADPNISNHLINALKNHKELITLLDQLKEFAPKILYLEKKKGKLALNDILKTLN